MPLCKYLTSASQATRIISRVQMCHYFEVTDVVDPCTGVLSTAKSMLARWVQSSDYAIFGLCPVHLLDPVDRDHCSRLVLDTGEAVNVLDTIRTHNRVHFQMHSQV